MLPRDKASLPFADIYIDESSQNQHRFLVIGGVIVPQEDVAEFLDGLRTARLPELPAGEMKWTKVSRTKLPAYKRVVDLFFSDRMASRAHFHSLIGWFSFATRGRHRSFKWQISSPGRWPSYTTATIRLRMFHPQKQS